MLRDRLLSSILDSTADGLLVVGRDGKALLWNSRFAAMWSIPPELLEARDDEAMIASVLDQLCEPERFVARIRELYEQPEVEDFDTIRLRDGRVFERYSIPFSGEGTIEGRVWSFRDVTKRKQVEELHRFVAYHDALTHLPNRLLFCERADRALNLERGPELSTAIVFLDLDRFKNVNDTLGHEVGDQLIRASARRLVESLRDTDTVSRLGGDEFAVLLPTLSAEAAAGVARKLLEVMRRPFELGGRRLHITASLGMALAPQHGSDLATLMKNADLAMYQAKSGGRDRLELFHSHMTRQVERMLEIENDLHQALAQEELEVDYQPIVAATTGEVVAMEALARWRRPDGRRRLPAAFIPVAEATGLIHAVGRLVLGAACRDIVRGRAALPALKRVAVNISPVQIRAPGFAEMVASCLSESGARPDDLELEITESLALQEQEQTLRALADLAELGVSISLDDFGTGYASLDLLRRLPLSRLKLDQSFVAPLCSSGRDQAIVAATIELAHVLGLEVIGEGVETAVQRDFLARHGCDLLQGYLLGRPAPFARLLETKPEADLPAAC